MSGQRKRDRWHCVIGGALIAAFVGLTALCDPEVLGNAFVVSGFDVPGRNLQNIRHHSALISKAGSGKAAPFHPKGGAHGTDRWYGRPRGVTLDRLLLLPEGTPYSSFACVVEPTQVKDPLRAGGWTKVLIGLADESRGDLALLALQWVNKCTDIQPGLPMYSAVLTACEKSGLWEQALSLHHDMVVQEMPQDVASYSAAITSCAKGAQWELAFRLLAQMQGPSRSN
eukprot:CAMPEP_0179185906 /NCGR_PEP_ID=MMETSP0796-20121207/92194_1 /TAXON_ID=73915 /ORGANISM="Pyrodinium bahamense, Strain pbaha01" /LENGTH=226 /DNA_ID=CAMNT_0020889877 /DNA_START=41 /DNA_END=718 /DNA_ORIENTATION=+